MEADKCIDNETEFTFFYLSVANAIKSIDWIKLNTNFSFARWCGFCQSFLYSISLINDWLSPFKERKYEMRKVFFRIEWRNFSFPNSATLLICY